jgi:hypothetical protein
MYGGPADGPLLAGIMGHNLCLDIFGGPSAEEAAAGLTAHGEASVVPYAIEASVDGVVARADFPLAAAEVRAPRGVAGDPHHGDRDGHERGRLLATARLAGRST